MRILIIEDDKDTAISLKELLGKFYVVENAFTGEDGEYKAVVNGYDLVIVDYFLPGIDGVQVCKRLRQAGVKTPILMLTGQFEVQNKIDAFDSGADDYVTKPFNFDELLARIRSLLRRQDNLPTNILSIDTLTLDINKKVVKRDDKIINLRRKELNLLEYLMRNAGKVITREMILDHIWDSEEESMSNIVEVHIKYLRDQIDKPFDKKLVKTVHGFGYKIEG